MKVVINKCWGGFSISLKCAELMAEMGNKQAADEVAEYEKKNKWVKYYLKHGKWPEECPKEEQPTLAIHAKYSKSAQFYGYGYTNEGNGYSRHNPELVAAVEQLGSAVASGEHAELKVVEIPDGVEYEIDEYDGMESIHEAHRSWG